MKDCSVNTGHAHGCLYLNAYAETNGLAYVAGCSSESGYTSKRLKLNYITTKIKIKIKRGYVRSLLIKFLNTFRETKTAVECHKSV